MLRRTLRALNLLDGVSYPTTRVVGIIPGREEIGVRLWRTTGVQPTVSAARVCLSRCNAPPGAAIRTEKFICGDMTTSMLKAHSGVSIMLQHCVVGPSRHPAPCRSARSACRSTTANDRQPQAGRLSTPARANGGTILSPGAKCQVDMGKRSSASY